MYLSVIFILTIVIPFLVMPKHIRIGILPPYRIVLLSMMGICTMAAVILMIASFSGQGVYAQLLEAAEIASDQMSSNPALVEAFGAGGISEAEMSKFLMQMYSKSFLLVPSGILFMGAITSYIAYIILSRIMSKNGEVKKMPKYREFTFPHGTAMAVMVMYLIGWIMLDSEAKMGEIIYANFSTIFDLVFVLQAIAVVFMFFHFKKVPQVVSVIACACMCVSSFGKTFMVLLGMADMFFGLRARMGSRPSGR